MKNYNAKKMKLMNKKPYKIVKNNEFGKRLNLPLDVSCELGDKVFIHEMKNKTLLISPVELFANADVICPVCGHWVVDNKCESSYCKGLR